jgi:hypothetical protein
VGVAPGYSQGLTKYGGRSSKVLTHVPGICTRPRRQMPTLRCSVYSRATATAATTATTATTASNPKRTQTRVLRVGRTNVAQVPNVASTNPTHSVQEPARRRPRNASGLCGRALVITLACGPHVRTLRGSGGAQQLARVRQKSKHGYAQQRHASAGALRSGAARLRLPPLRPHGCTAQASAARRPPAPSHPAFDVCAAADAGDRACPQHPPEVTVCTLWRPHEELYPTEVSLGRCGWPAMGFSL